MIRLADFHYQWIFRGGNIVICDANPFSKEAIDEFEQNSSLIDPDIVVIGPGLRLLRNHILTVDQHGIIKECGKIHEFDVEGAEELDNFVKLRRTDFLCPGLIDTHIHAPQFSYSGTATDLPLMDWLHAYTFPAEIRLGLDIHHARQVYRAVVDTTLKAGTTTAVYYATLDLEPCKVLVDTVLELGQRAFVGKVCMDRNAPHNYCHSTERNVRETKELIEFIQDRNNEEEDTLPLVFPMVTPRFIPTCTPALLTELGKLAASYQCHISSHISESIDEVGFSRQLDADEDLRDGIGRTDAPIFDSHGLLTDKCIMAHGVHLEEDDIKLMQTRGSAISHCPLSNFFFAGGTLPCRKLLEREFKVCLGTDIAGGFHPSLLNSSRLCTIASRALDQQRGCTGDSILDYRHAFYLATLGGARALGLDGRLGKLCPGYEFDAFTLSAEDDSPVNIFDADSIQDIFQKLCVLADDRNVKSVFVKGRYVKGNLFL